MRFFAAVVLLALGVGSYLSYSHTKVGCDFRKGKWSSSTSSCILKSCYYSNSCGTWANPIQWCSNLEVGDSIQEVYFQLGQPESIDVEIYKWNSAKGNNDKIKAIIPNEELIEIECKTI